MLGLSGWFRIFRCGATGGFWSIPAAWSAGVQRDVPSTLEPAPVAIVAAATENQQYDDYDQKCVRVH